MNYNKLTIIVSFSVVTEKAESYTNDMYDVFAGNWVRMYFEVPHHIILPVELPISTRWAVALDKLKATSVPDALFHMKPHTESADGQPQSPCDDLHAEWRGVWRAARDYSHPYKYNK